MAPKQNYSPGLRCLLKRCNSKYIFQVASWRSCQTPGFCLQAFNSPYQFSLIISECSILVGSINCPAWSSVFRGCGKNKFFVHFGGSNHPPEIFSCVVGQMWKKFSPSFNKFIFFPQPLYAAKCLEKQNCIWTFLETLSQAQFNWLRLDLSKLPSHSAMGLAEPTVKEETGCNLWPQPVLRFN